MLKCSHCGDVGIVRSVVDGAPHREVCVCITEEVDALCGLPVEDAVSAVHDLLEGLGAFDA